MLEFDPIANIFPLIEGQARDDFRADIGAKGLQEKIVLRAGRVLDGRNRYLSLVHLGEVAEDAPADMLLKHDGRFVDFDVEHPDTDPFDWVMSLNVHRRHLEPSQWAAVAANAETLKHGGSRRAAKPEAAVDDTGSGQSQDASLQLDRAALSKTFNVSPRLIASAAKVRKHGAPELFDAIAQGKVKATVAEQLLTLPKGQQVEAATALEARKLPTLAKQTKRADTERRLADKVRALPTKLYSVIYADPATKFVTRSELGMDRSAENHYPTMTIEELKALPVGTLAAPDTLLACWSTAPQLEATLGVIRFWGFRYVAHFIWDKRGNEDEPDTAPPGMGFWSRVDHEVLIFATRGNPPCPAPGENWPSVYRERKTDHSSKPLHYTLMLESYFPNLPKIELNKRGEARPGWEYWGNEAPLSLSPPGPVEEDVSPETASGGDGVEGENPAPSDGEVAGAGASLSPPDPVAAYLALVASTPVPPGGHSKATAEPILRAAYAVEPPIPLDRVATDLGAKKNTVLSWAHRLKLSKTERRSTNGSADMRKARSQLASGGGVA